MTGLSLTAYLHHADLTLPRVRVHLPLARSGWVQTEGAAFNDREDAAESLPISKALSHWASLSIKTGLKLSTSYQMRGQNLQVPKVKPKGKQPASGRAGNWTQVFHCPLSPPRTTVKLRGAGPQVQRERDLKNSNTMCVEHALTYKSPVQVIAFNRRRPGRQQWGGAGWRAAVVAIS